MPHNLPPPPHNSMISTAHHQHALEQERQRAFAFHQRSLSHALAEARRQDLERYNTMHTHLSSEIERLTTALQETRKRAHQAQTALKTSEQKCKELQETAQILKERLQKCQESERNHNESLRTTKKALKASQKRTKELDNIVTQKRAREQQVAAANGNKPKRIRIPQPDSKQEVQWEFRFQQLKEFQQRHGHCNVSFHNNDHDVELARWVVGQRTQHRYLRNGKHSQLRSDRIQKLMSIGFEWSNAKTQALSFEERFKQLQAYKDKHGHTNVPQKCMDPPGLGGFVQEQRRSYNNRLNGKVVRGFRVISTEEIAALEALGFQWKLRDRGPAIKQQPTQESALVYHDL